MIKKNIERDLARMQKELSELIRKQRQLQKELEEERKKPQLPKASRQDTT